MRLPFEDWLDQQEFVETASDLFNEAIVCYKASAYRAAMLLSYLGFLNVLKSRMFNAALPNGIPIGQWNSMQNNLRSDDRWDSTAFDATQQRNPAAIFLVSDDVRQQVVYWKNRRNDCAHSRTNKIGYAHVEAFWLFLISNIARFVVNGSRADLIERLRRHYDTSITPPGQDPRSLVDRIPTAVDPAELHDFFIDAEREVFSLKRLFDLPSAEEVGFFELILRLNSPAVVTAATMYIEQNAELMLAILRADPTLVPTLANGAPQIRNLWFDRLFSTFRQDLAIYCALLRNGLIPAAELNEAHERVIRRWRNEIPAGQCFDQLRASQFFQHLERIAFELTLIDQFDWGNRNSDFVAWYVDNHPLNRTIVRGIASTFSVPNFPFELRDALDELFRANPAKRDEFHTIATAERISLPQHIASLH